jgi:hypothetical protein
MVVSSCLLSILSSLVYTDSFEGLAVSSPRKSAKLYQDSRSSHNRLRKGLDLSTKKGLEEAWKETGMMRKRIKERKTKLERGEDLSDVYESSIASDDGDDESSSSPESSGSDTEIEATPTKKQRKK